MLTVASSHRAPAHAVHGNSMHAKIREVLDKGLHHEWDAKSFATLTGLSERSALYIFERGEFLNVSRYPAKSLNGCLRRASGLSVLLYLVNHSDEITAEDVLPALKKMLPLLTDAVLEGVSAACKALIARRSGMPVIVKTTPPKPRPQQADLFAGMPELFTPAPDGAGETTTPKPKP